MKPAAAGLLMEKELTYLEKCTKNPAHPCVGILGGAKVSDKIEVIENLLKNAAESMENKQGRIIVAVKSSNKNFISITFSDNGKGMTGQQRRQVFLPGYTTKKRGWGLGLNLCKRIVEDYHKGKIYIKDTTPGKGTTFTVEIPKNA